MQKRMTCEYVEEKLSSYLDGMLSEDETAAVSAHLAQCEACGKEADDLKDIISLLHDIPQTPIPAHFELDFKRKLKQETEKNKEIKPRKKSIWKAMSAAAAILTVGILSVAMLQDGLHFNLRDLAVGGGESGADMSSSAGFDESDTEDKGSPYTDGSYEAISAPQSEEKQSADKCEKAEQESGDEGITYSTNISGTLSGAVASNVSPTPQQPTNRAAQAAPQSAAQEADPGGSGIKLMTDDSDGDQSAEEDSLYSAHPGDVTDAGVSRGGGMSSPDDYNKACSDWIIQYTNAINTKDASLFADTVAIGGINGYTTDTAVTILKLYTDYLGTDTVTSKQLRFSSEKMENRYVIEGNHRQLRVDMKDTAFGLKVSETLLNLGPWLSGQLGETEYFLEGYEVKNGGGEVLFRVKIENPSSGETTDAGVSEKQQIKEIIWKKTE